MRVKWSHAWSKRVVWVLVMMGLRGEQRRAMHDTQRWRGRCRLNYNWRFMADTVSCVHTQKEPLRDSDLLVLTVCCYRQNREREREKQSLVSWSQRWLVTGHLIWARFCKTGQDRPIQNLGIYTVFNDPKVQVIMSNKWPCNKTDCSLVSLVTAYTMFVAERPQRSVKATLYFILNTTFTGLHGFWCPMLRVNLFYKGRTNIPSTFSSSLPSPPWLVPPCQHLVTEKKSNSSS